MARTIRPQLTQPANCIECTLNYGHANHVRCFLLNDIYLAAGLAQLAQTAMDTIEALDQGLRVSADLKPETKARNEIINSIVAEYSGGRFSPMALVLAYGEFDKKKRNNAAAIAGMLFIIYADSMFNTVII